MVKFWKSSESGVRIPDTDSGSGLDWAWQRSTLFECSYLHLL